MLWCILNPICPNCGVRDLPSRSADEESIDFDPDGLTRTGRIKLIRSIQKAASVPTGQEANIPLHPLFGPALYSSAPAPHKSKSDANDLQFVRHKPASYRFDRAELKAARSTERPFPPASNPNGFQKRSYVDELQIVLASCPPGRLCPEICKWNSFTGPVWR